MESLKWRISVSLLAFFGFLAPSYAAFELRDEGTGQAFVWNLNCVGANVSCTTSGADGTLTISGGAGGNSFETISVPAGTNPVADSSTDTLTITETSPLVITGNDGTDTIDITFADDSIDSTLLADVDFGDFTCSDAGGVGCLIDADAVALTTDTTGNYVAIIGDGTGIDGSCSSEGCTYTPSTDSGETSFLRTDVILTCGAGTAGRLVNTDGGTTLEYCDDGGTPTLRTLVARDTTDTLTNKTIDTTNTVTIDVTDITADASATWAGQVTDETGTGVWVFGTSPTITTSLTQDGDAADAGYLRLQNAASIAWEASPAGTDVTLAVDTSEEVLLDNAVGLGLDDQSDLRFYETDANGTNFLAFEAPAAITTTSTCTLENDANPIPDACVGDGVDAGGTDTNADKVFLIPASGCEPIEAADSIPPLSKFTGTNIDIYTRSLDATTDEGCKATVKIPDDVQSGSTITFGFVWFSRTATTGSVVWNVRYTATGADSEPWDAALTTETVTCAVDATTNDRDLCEVTETLANTGWAAGDIITVMPYRDANHVSDDMTGDAELETFYIEVPRA